MYVHAHHTVDHLARDIRKAAVKIEAGLPRLVKRNAELGQKLARESVRRNAPIYGVHYDDAITTERTGKLEWEYGPDSAMPQGGMSFEFGSRNQKPHLDLNNAADIVGPKLARDVHELIARAFRG